jgi:hypothetical protein
MWTGERNTKRMWYSNLGQRFAGGFVTPCLLNKISDTCPPIIFTRTLASEVLWTVNFLRELQPVK